MPDAAPLSLIFILVTFVVWALLALGFLMIASRVVTRVVLDEIDKHRRSRGRV